MCIYTNDGGRFDVLNILWGILQGKQFVIKWLFSFNRSLNDVLPYILRKFNNKVYSRKWSSFLHFSLITEPRVVAIQTMSGRGQAESIHIIEPWFLASTASICIPHDPHCIIQWQCGLWADFHLNYLNFWDEILNKRETTWIQTCKVKTILWEIIFEVLFFPTRTCQIHRWILHPFLPYSALTNNWTGYCLIMCSEGASWVCCLTGWNTRAPHCTFSVLNCLVSDSIGGITLFAATRGQ